MDSRPLPVWLTIRLVRIGAVACTSGLSGVTLVSATRGLSLGSESPVLVLECLHGHPWNLRNHSSRVFSVFGGGPSGDPSYDNYAVNTMP